MGNSPSSPPEDAPRVVIVGGGYGGITAAMKLLNKVHLTVIDERDCLHHNVAAVRACVVPGYAPKTFIPFAPALGSSFKQGRVIDIDIHDRFVTLVTGEKVHYDTLILATGSTGNFPSKSGSECHTRDEGIAAYEAYVKRISKASKIALVGGGPVGVELAAEIKAQHPGKQVTLIHPSNELVSQSTTEKFQDKLWKILTDMNIDLVLGERVQNLEDVPQTPSNDEQIKLKLTSGKWVQCDMCIQCTGLSVNTAAFCSTLGDKMDKDGNLKVDNHLKVEGCPNVYAIGDCSNTHEVHLAYVADHMGEYMADTIMRMYNKKEVKPYETVTTMTVVSLGPNKGLGEVSGYVLPSCLITMLKSRGLFCYKTWKKMNQKMPS